MEQRWKHCKKGGVTNIHLPRYLFQVVTELERKCKWDEIVMGRNDDGSGKSFVG